MTADITSISNPLWPFATTSIDADGWKLAMTDVGRGAPILFVHVPFGSFLWRHVVQRLRADHRCISVDAPGTGRSVPVPAEAISLESAARAVTNVIDTLDLQNLTLVFHDLGGIAALAAAARRPERIAALVAVNTFGWHPSRALDIMLRIVGSGLVTSIDVRWRVIARLTSSGFGAGRNAGESTRERILATLDRRALRAFHLYIREARRATALYSEIETALHGSLRDRPLLTIFGERNDPFGFQRRWKELFPGALQIVVPGGNHFPMCDDPDLFAASIKTWLHEGVEN
jgi:pimeloyl-ACP methyl ester carboxylesterase